jgi:transitional endoplasmic reticulum ATPase
MKNIPITSDVDIATLAKNTQGYVGADIEAICREAAILALRRDIKALVVTKADFDEALKTVKPSVSAEIEESYKKLADQFRMARGKEMQQNAANYFG